MDQQRDHDHDRGLAVDLARLDQRRRPVHDGAHLDRRRALTLLAGAGLVAVVGCGSDDGEGTAATTTSTSTSSSTSTSISSSADAGCTTIPEETAGPFPGDGSNGPNALSESGIVRSDIRSSFGGASGVADGVPLTIELTVLDTANGCAAFAGAAVYLWHCDREGRYSMYSEGVIDENYLRGVQETDADGAVRFTSTFPGAYSGRWPHVHFEVYRSLAEATSAGSVIATSQLALPADACDQVYATEGYDESVGNLAQISLETDNIFADGVAQQLATVTGSVSAGFAATLSVPV